ncbi:MAG: hypothetical protein ACRCWF_13650 [Beijerinckiaceae bacterium]
MASAYQPIALSKSLALIETGASERIDSAAASPSLRAYRSDSNFVAHLLAVKLDAPAMRVKRRATPAEAITAYAAATGQRSVPVAIKRAA